MDGDSGVAEQGFGSGCCDTNIPYPTHQWISDCPEVVFFLFVLYFDIGKAGLVLCAVVDDTLTSVDELVFP